MTGEESGEQGRRAASRSEFLSRFLRGGQHIRMPAQLEIIVGGKVQFAVAIDLEVPQKPLFAPAGKFLFKAMIKWLGQGKIIYGMS